MVMLQLHASMYVVYVYIHTHEAREREREREREISSRKRLERERGSERERERERERGERERERREREARETHSERGGGREGAGGTERGKEREREREEGREGEKEREREPLGNCAIDGPHQDRKRLPAPRGQLGRWCCLMVVLRAWAVIVKGCRLVVVSFGLQGLVAGWSCVLCVCVSLSPSLSHSLFVSVCACCVRVLNVAHFVVVTPALPSRENSGKCPLQWIWASWGGVPTAS